MKVTNTGLRGITVYNYDASLTASVDYLSKLERGVNGWSLLDPGCKVS